jgi:hypothetical protein
MKKLLSTLSTSRNLIILFVLFGVFYYLLAASSFSFSDASFKTLTGSQTLDLKQWYSAQEAQTLLTNLGQEGESAYRTFHLLDALFFIPVATLFFASMLFVLWGKSPNRWVSSFYGIQLITGTCDLLENIFIEFAIARLPESSQGALSLASFISATKSITWSISSLLIVIGFVYWIFLKLKKK